MTTTKAAQWGVWAKLSWGEGNEPGTRFRKMVIGRGEAGYTMYTFTSEQAACDFATALPVCSRMPSHARAPFFPL